MTVFILLITGCSASPSKNYLSLYTGFGTAKGVVIEGRLSEDKPRDDAAANDSAWTNFWRTTSHFTTDERKHVPVKITAFGLSWPAVTDDEGYFRVDLGATTHPIYAGWHTVSPGEGVLGEPGQVLVVPVDNRTGIISDVDDTILKTDVTDKDEMLKNTFLLNGRQRQVVPGTKELFENILSANSHPESAPMIYLTGSPEQLYISISDFLKANSYPPGVLLAKRINDKSIRGGNLDQAAYKSRKIEEVLQRLPWVHFTLVGDDGENDPQIYAAIRDAFPERIDAIVIRHVKDGKGHGGFDDINDLNDAISALHQ